MDGILTGVRKGDAVLAGLVTAAGVLNMVENVRATDAAIRIDSHSWLLVPAYLAVTVPVLWRRRNLVGVLAVTATALVAHVLAFGWVTRCGSGLPLSIALAYSAGRLMRGSAAWGGLVAALAIQFLVLVRDSSAGLGVMPATAVMSLIAFGVGALLARRAARPSPLDAAVATPAGV
jgi:hypothetical protein